MNTLDQLFFGVHPYICLAVFSPGSLMRFDRGQYTWKSDSNKLLCRGQLRPGNILFHAGALAVFLGHLFGLLIPPWFWEFIGVSHQARQIIATTAGDVFGSAALADLIILIRHRFEIEHIDVNSTWRDKPALVWLLIALLLGLSIIFVSMGHLGGEETVKLIQWTQHIVTFRGGTASYLGDVNFLFKMHIFTGMTFFFIFPFTRMIHVWSDFASIFRIGRAWQLMRRC